MDILTVTPRLLRFGDDGVFPNSVLPVLFYPAALQVDASEGVSSTASAIEAIFAAHQWLPDWRDGIYDYHHYHSTAHEALGVAAGDAQIMLGGPNGEVLPVGRGDVLILPAGTSHCAVTQSHDFLVVGAYPLGQKWDVMKGLDGERPASLQRIAQVPIPKDDPIGGALLTAWRV
ncbi:cupin [Hydrocarboniphaga effusa]|uniref:cupin n=1 Tax=Hydrocarboniphaga effusa TaxID=243629 RepID=UPI0035B2AF4F